MFRARVIKSSVHASSSSSFQDEEIPLLDDRPQLSFQAENRNLSGKYTCVATNDVGDPAKAHIDLRIRCKSTCQHLYISILILSYFSNFLSLFIS